MTGLLFSGLFFPLASNLLAIQFIRNLATLMMLTARMKFSILFFLGFLLSCSGFAQHSIVHEGLVRTYNVYVPNSINGSQPSPVVLNFHGLGSDANQQQFYTLFNQVAQQEKFIVVYPNGVNNAWNSGAVAQGIANDVGFVADLIDTLAMNYNVDLNRVYATGMSNGGFMSLRLACELENKIAAIASVTGLLATTVEPTCQPSRAVPTMVIHGTLDNTVNYNGLFNYYLGAQATVDHFVAHNNCQSTPIVTNIPNTNLMDLCTATRYYYGSGDNGSEVELYKIDGGGHSWPGAAIDFAGVATNRDIKASEVIWEFFNRHSLNGLVSSDELPEEILEHFTISPNPFSENLSVGYDGNNPLDVKLVDMNGKVWFEQQHIEEAYTIPTENLGAGLYFMSITMDGNTIIRKVIKQ